MDSNIEFSHDEEGYCGLTYDDFVEKCPNFDGNDFDLEGDCPHPFGFYDTSEPGPFLKNVSRVATRILSSSKFLTKTRRMFWGYFLGAYNQESLSDLAKYVKKCRVDYWMKVEEYNRKNSIEQIHSLDPQIFHPLAPAETNPWAMSQMTKEMMDEIWQDVERTYQERTLFQNDSVRKTLQRILFVWSMEHDYISYKQGMNELLAIIYIVCYRDQDRSVVEHNEESFQHYKTIFSDLPKDIEADSYTLFNCLMTKDLQIMYDISALKHFNKLKASLPNPPNQIIARCNHIYNDLLKECDFVLYAHLKNIELEPHLFLIRWIRLIFSREFNVNETLNLWDFLLSDYYFELKSGGESQQFPFQSIDFFSVAMIIFVKQNLMENDINYCLQRLFKYPPIEDISLLTKKALDIKRGFLKQDHEEDEEYERFHDAYEYEEERAMGGENKRQLSNSVEFMSSIDNTPKSVPIKMLDDSTILDSSNGSSNETSENESPHLHLKKEMSSIGLSTESTNTSARSGYRNVGSCKEGIKAGFDSETVVATELSSPKNLRKELMDVACKIYGIYESELKNSNNELLASLKGVHTHVSKIISNLDSLALNQGQFE
ncbi:uncharacterized protein TOT_040000650 [Theileria orientalis strain Shintoku]|uniref:Rab-GAP TBC domain-containing protein n=1 Tax=Theileria orientalis strain Shintoku TaxID=869250 RepID=J4C4J2_THEOR|nr:uncharacterized protein TOT_040000650 [Theileria orientalis strain Shintoku]PVC53133.1 hypothetical protein MACL_00000309 [Theileria orientalis]BAM42281.1 uncharacterized protein TOT_040000650 [Theileria orientalis strain Shintoku]|eukprot:XP_009692582.1 uncharacterized protein TOT_040000650 [Theileria orientalis strain Shintoku]